MPFIFLRYFIIPHFCFYIFKLSSTSSSSLNYNFQSSKEEVTKSTLPDDDAWERIMRNNAADADAADDDDVIRNTTSKCSEVNFVDLVDVK